MDRTPACAADRAGFDDAAGAVMRSQLRAFVGTAILLGAPTVLALDTGCTPVAPHSLDEAALSAARGKLLKGSPLIVQRCVDDYTRGHWTFVWDVVARDGNWREYAFARCSGLTPPKDARECWQQRRVATGLDDDAYVAVGNDIDIATVRQLVAAAMDVETGVRVSDVDYVAVPNGGAWSAMRFGYEVTYLVAPDYDYGRDVRLVMREVDGRRAWWPKAERNDFYRGRGDRSGCAALDRRSRAYTTVTNAIRDLLAAESERIFACTSERGGATYLATYAALERSAGWVLNAEVLCEAATIDASEPNCRVSALARRDGERDLGIGRGIRLDRALELRKLAQPLVQPNEFVNIVDYQPVTDGGTWDVRDEGYGVSISAGNHGREYRFVERCASETCRLQVELEAGVSSWAID